MLKTHNLKEFQEAARVYARGLTPFPDRATVVGLVGNLGAGKTTFVQAAAKALGIKEKVASPTFLIMKSYKLLDLRFEFFIHIDAYRLKHSYELRTLGFADLLSDSHNLIFIEWADKVVDLLPHHTQTISFEYLDEETRKITF